MKKVRYLRPVLKWWIIFCSLIFAALYSHVSIDLFTSLNQADITKLSFVVIGVFYLYMIALGVQLSKFCKNVFNQRCSEALTKMRIHGWFLSDIFMALGFLGTLVGFVYMLDLTGLAAGDTAKLTLVTLTTGMKTALYTTIMALISSIVIKCTLYILESDIERIEKEKECKLT